jgi:hypothetical protein
MSWEVLFLVVFASMCSPCCVCLVSSLLCFPCSVLDVVCLFVVVSFLCSPCCVFLVLFSLCLPCDVLLVVLENVRKLMFALCVLLFAFKARQSLCLQWQSSKAASPPPRHASANAMALAAWPATGGVHLNVVTSDSLIHSRPGTYFNNLIVYGLTLLPPAP